MRISAPTLRAWIVPLVTLAVLFGIAGTTLVINASWSAPHWGYARIPIYLWPFDIKRGDWIQFTPPVEAPWPYVKQVRGVAGDVVGVRDDRTVTVNGEPVGIAKTRSLDGRPLDVALPTIIPAGHHFVLAPHPDSHDSRYAEIGLIPGRAVMARVWPLPDIPVLGLEGPIITEARLKEAMKDD